MNRPSLDVSLGLEANFLGLGPEGPGLGFGLEGCGLGFAWRCQMSVTGICEFTRIQNDILSSSGLECCRLGPGLRPRSVDSSICRHLETL